MGAHLGMWEAMDAYSRGTGLRPVGPHRPAADRLLHELSSTCPTCSGEQVFEADGKREWCATCRGLGRTFRDGGKEELIRRVSVEFPDAVAGDRPTGEAGREGDSSRPRPLQSAVFADSSASVPYPQAAVDRIIWNLRSKSDGRPAWADLHAVGEWLAGSLAPTDPEAEGVVILFDALLDLVSADDLPMVGEDVADERRLYLKAWLDVAFDAPDENAAGRCARYCVQALHGSDGSVCHCLYLVTGDGLSGVDYQICAFARGVDEAVQHLRESIGVIDSDWDKDKERVLRELVDRGVV